MARRELSQRRLERREDAIWNRNLHLQDKNISAQYRDIDAADDIRQRTREKVSEILEKAQSDAASSSAKIRSSYASKEKELLSATRTALTGATRGRATPLMVWHWKAAMPAELRERFEIDRTDAGPILGLPPGGGMESSHSIPDLLVTEQPELLSDATFMEWAKTVSSIWHDEVSKRYQILARLRDDDWFAEFAEAVGIHDPRKGEEPLRGRYGEYKRPVVLNVIPSISRVEVDEDGLVLTFAHNAKASAKAWSAKLDLIRNGWKAAGMDASHLRLTDAADGGVQMRFDDAPSAFPKAAASMPVTAPHTEAEAIQAYPKLRWRFGLDARENEIGAVIKDNPHIALIAQTGWGKSVMSASLIENLRPFGSWWLFDGKGSDHPVQLAQQPGVSWISKTAPEHIVGMKWLWDEMNERYLEADRRKAMGQAGRAFDFPPLFVLIDETPSLRGGIEEHDKKGMPTFDFWVQDLLQKGRQARIHLVTISQSLYVDSLPAKWQMNLSRVLFLGPISGRSLQSDTVPESVRERIAAMTARIPESAKGRGVFLDKSDGEVRPIQIQTYYDFAPGSVEMSMAPTPEVAEVWEKQRANLENRPVLFDRVGIRVEDDGWRSLPVEDLAELPTMVIADEHGAISGMEVYDPLSPDFRGRVQIASNPHRARGRGSVAPALGAASNSRPGHPVTPKGSHGRGQSVEFDADSVPTDAVTAGAAPTAPVPTGTAPALDLDSLTPAQRDALLARLLSARVTAEDVSAEAPALTKSEEPAISPEKSIRTSAAQKGFSL